MRQESQGRRRTQGIPFDIKMPGHIVQIEVGARQEYIKSAATVVQTGMIPSVLRGIPNRRTAHFAKSVMTA
jgi:hypothetical protein